MVAKRKGDMQDGMLAYYLEQAKFSDANVEARLEREPFDFRNMTRIELFRVLRAAGVSVSLPVTTEELRIAASRVAR